MNAKSNLKLSLDIILTVLFLILIDPKNTGFSFHEIAGLSIAALFSFHVILNWKWVKSVSKNLFSSKLKARPKLYYILNLISLLSVATIIFTGIVISRVLFASDAAVANHTYVLVHKWMSYFCLVLFGVHTTLHWRFIINTLRKLLGSFKAGSFKPVMTLAAAALVIGLTYAGIASLGDLKPVQADARRDPSGRPIDMYQNNGKRGQYGGSSYPNTAISSTTSIQNSNTGVSSSTSGGEVTLSEFLGKMFCNACDKHCCLLNPQCGKGFQQVETATIQYQQQYGQNSTS